MPHCFPRLVPVAPVYPVAVPAAGQGGAVAKLAVAAADLGEKKQRNI